jgi:hypothetical protein
MAINKNMEDSMFFICDVITHNSDGEVVVDDVEGNLVRVGSGFIQLIVVLLLAVCQGGRGQRGLRVLRDGNVPTVQLCRRRAFDFLEKDNLTFLTN